MQELFTKKAKKFIGIAALTCFLTTPLSYTVSLNSAAAAPDNKIAVEQRHDSDQKDKGFSSDKDKKPVAPSDKDKKDNGNPPTPPPNDNGNPPTPPPNDKDKQDPPPPPNDNNKNNDGKDYDKGDIATAVLVGGVVGAVVAKNT